MGTPVVLADRVLVSTTTTGTGTYSLGSAVTGYLTPALAGVSTGARLAYVAVDSLSTPTVFEVGEGIYTSGSPATLTRAQIRRNTTGGTSAINWGAGTKYIMLAPGAANLPTLDTDGALVAPAMSISGAATVGGALTATTSLNVGGTATVTGDTTMAGNLTIAKSFPGISLEASASGQTRYIFGRTGTSPRWLVELGNLDAETGSNTGSDFAIARYSDAGAWVGYPFRIVRSTGRAIFAIAPEASASPTAAEHLTRKDYVDGIQSFGANGYRIMPGGMILQWVTVSVGNPGSGGGSTGTATWPFAFPNTCFQVFATVDDTTGYLYACVSNKSTTGASWRVQESASVTQSVSLYLLAIGN